MLLNKIMCIFLVVLPYCSYFETYDSLGRSSMAINIEMLTESTQGDLMLELASTIPHRSACGYNPRVALRQKELS